MTRITEESVEANTAKIFGTAEPMLELTEQNYPSLGHLISEKLDLNSDAELFIDAASERRWTGGQLKEKILNVATALVDMGLEPGSAVCIIQDHSDYNCILALAVVFAGGLVTCGYPKDPYAELLDLARKVEPKMIFCPQKSLHWAERLGRDLGYEVKGIAVDGTPDNQASSLKFFTHFDHLLNYDHRRSKSIDRVPYRCRDIFREVAFISMSSGTTGRPKAVPATHAKCLTDFFGLHNGNSREIRFVSSASLDYVSGRLIIMGAIKTGHSVVILDGFEANKFLRAIEKYKGNVVFLGAASFYQLITCKDIDKYDISSLRCIFPMGAKIVYLDELRKFLQKNPNIVDVRQGYGTSEFAGAALNSMTPEKYLEDCDNCGKLLPGVRAKIVDLETGKLLGKNQPGLLHILHTTSFPGYYDLQAMKQAQLNGETEPSPIYKDSSIIDEDGYYITGDISYFNDKDELFIEGRLKEMMSCRAAKKVLPQELEDIIMQHPLVSKVCVLGVSDRKHPLVQCPRAFILLQAGCYSENFQFTPTQRLEEQDKLSAGDEQADEVLEHKGQHKLCRLMKETRHRISEDIMEFVNDRVGWDKQLTGGIVLLDEILTMKSSGKINKSDLRSLGLDQVEIYGDRSGLEEGRQT